MLGLIGSIVGAFGLLWGYMSINSNPGLRP